MVLDAPREGTAGVMAATAPILSRHEQASPRPEPHVAFLLGNLHGGGVQRMTMLLADGLAAQGARVDLVVCDTQGELGDQISSALHMVALEHANAIVARLAVLRADPRGVAAWLRPLTTIKYASPTLGYLPSLARYLRRARPDSLFSATSYLNTEAVLARRLAGVPTRLVLSDRSHFSSGKPRKAWRQRHLAAAMRRTYEQADAITAVSNGVADDIARSIGIAREAITTLYNPTITPDFAARASQPIAHPWFADGAPPVLLAVGRTTFQKDFSTLLRAFARVRRDRPVRLAIIGEASAKQAARLRDLAGELAVQDDFALLGYHANPLPYMSHAAVFALSSRYEGFPNVLLEALACGTPVVSTDCPSGPSEILDGGAYGALVPVADDAALAAAIAATLADPPDRAWLQARAAMFDYRTAIARYAAVLLGETADRAGRS
jgi:glycosyltransferase involved in cell wall biosynthesis